MQSVKVVLFDLDDTLIHFDDYWEDSLREALRSHPVTQAHNLVQLFGLLNEMNAVFEEQYHRQQITLRQFRNYRLMHAMSRMGQDIGEEIAEQFNALHMDISKSYMKASPELVALLTELKDSCRLGIVTNGTSKWQRDKLEALEINALLEPEAVLISEEVGFEKPSPEIYEQALRIFHVQPQEIIFVGDSWNNDVVGPMKAGMRSVWFNKKGLPAPEGITPYGIIANIAELRTLLQRDAGSERSTG